MFEQFAGHAAPGAAVKTLVAAVLATPVAAEEA